MRKLVVVSAVALGAAIPGAAVAVAAGPQQTVTASLIARPAHTLAPGTKVSGSKISGQRVFVDATHGFALVDTGQAQYSAATADGGKTWKTDGPALHIDAAQAPLAVVDIGAAGRNTVFAWGGGQVIDTTSDGGKHWYRALFTQGIPVAVLKDLRGHLVAFVDGSATTWQYVSKDGGKTWHLDTTQGGS
jgi:hypothetical protein